MGEVKACQICKGEGIVGYTIDGEQPTLEGCPRCSAECEICGKRGCTERHRPTGGEVLCEVEPLCEGCSSFCDGDCLADAYKKRIIELETAVKHYITVACDPDLPDDDMQRYDDALESLADVIGGKPPRVDGSGYTLKNDYWQLVETLRECDEYLKPNPKNAIGSGSILHQKIQSALQKSNDDG